MTENIMLLDCTLRDGAYITESHFGTPAIKGIIKKLQEARVDIIEVGWLKDKQHEEGTTFFHLPTDVVPYLVEPSERTTYVAMIDWDRYDTEQLPPCDGASIDAIRSYSRMENIKKALLLQRNYVQKGIVYSCKQRIRWRTAMQI